MERQVARTGARAQGDDGRVAGRQRALVRVEAENTDLVRAKVRNENEALFGVEIERVGMGLRLPRGVDASSAVTDECRSRAY